MTITITRIDFTIEETRYFDGGEPIEDMIAAHINYSVRNQGNTLEGSIDIDFNDYKEMKHADFIALIETDLIKFL